MGCQSMQMDKRRSLSLEARFVSCKTCVMRFSSSRGVNTRPLLKPVCASQMTPGPWMFFLLFGVLSVIFFHHCCGPCLDVAPFLAQGDVKGSGFAWLCSCAGAPGRCYPCDVCEVCPLASC